MDPSPPIWTTGGSGSQFFAPNGDYFVYVNNNGACPGASGENIILTHVAPYERFALVFLSHFRFEGYGMLLVIIINR